MYFVTRFQIASLNPQALQCTCSVASRQAVQEDAWPASSTANSAMWPRQDCTVPCVKKKEVEEGHLPAASPPGRRSRWRRALCPPPRTALGATAGSRTGAPPHEACARGRTSCPASAPVPFADISSHALECCATNSICQVSKAAGRPTGAARSAYPGLHQSPGISTCDEFEDHCRAVSLLTILDTGACGAAQRLPRAAPVAWRQHL